MRDNINPEHYGWHPIECIEVTRHFNFNLGNAIKYIWRSGRKDNAIEDLQKAIWYLSDEIKRTDIKNDVFLCHACKARGEIYE